MTQIIVAAELYEIFMDVAKGQKGTGRMRVHISANGSLDYAIIDIIASIGSSGDTPKARSRFIGRFASSDRFRGVSSFFCSLRFMGVFSISQTILVLNDYRFYVIASVYYILDGFLNVQKYC